MPGDDAAVGATAACEDEVGRLANDVQWWSRGAGPLEPGLPNEPYDEYVFAGSVDVLAERQEERSEDASASAPAPGSPARLAGIVLPVVFSPWVLDEDSAGDWRAVLDPAAEIEVACAGAATRQPDGSVVPRAGPCGGLGFALSTFEPEVEEGDEDDDAAGPAAILLEVTFSGELCAGCRLVGGGERGELFRVRHARGASLDFVGPTVGALECAPGGPAGAKVERVTVLDAFDAATSDAAPSDASPSPEGVVAQGEDRDVSSCEGRSGLNLKGEILNNGGELIKGKAEDCCWECKQDPRCNVWVYCEGDCVDFAYHSCWLKRAAVAARDDPPAAWAANPDVPWTSGWFPPKLGVVREPPAAAAAPEPDEETSAERTPAPATPTPTIRVVPVGAGAVQPPAPTPTPAVATPAPGVPDAGVPAFEAPDARDEEEAPAPPLPPARKPPAAANVTLVPGEPAVIPDSVITILPGEDETPTETQTETPTETRTSPPASDASASSYSASFSCGEDAAAVCPSSSADPLAAANVRGSFQLLRERTEDDAEESSSASRLTLLRPNDIAREIFVTGTLINAGDAPACVGGLELAFDFPRAVIDPDTGNVVVAPPEDFVVRCFYVGVRSRQASTPSPGTVSFDAVGGSAPRACDDVVRLRMTDAGPVAAFEEDVALCPGCWLVGGRDGVLFSWKHRDAARFAMAAPFGDAVGYAGARCAER